QRINTPKNTIKVIEYIYRLYKESRRSLLIYEFSSCRVNNIIQVS
ncbi:IS6 family transposase, partial [Staphylococcus aureus]